METRVMSRFLQPLMATVILCGSLHADIVAESRVFGQKYAIRVPEKAVKDAPEWTQNLDNPPLSARKAIEAATAMQKDLVKDTDSHAWKLHSLALKRHQGDLWYWEAYFHAEPRGPSTGAPTFLRLIVL